MPGAEPSACPQDLEEATLEDALSEAGGEGHFAAADHAAGCRACARVLFQGLSLQALERRARSARPESPSLPRSPVPWRGGRQAWPAAAAVLLLASGLAVASLLVRPAPVLVGSGAGDTGLVGEIALRSGLDFAAAGVGPGSRVLGWATFLHAEGRLGTAALVRREEDRSPDLLAFGPDGALLGMASAEPGVAALLREQGVHPVGVRNLVLERRAGRPVETLVLLLARKDRSLLLLFEPGTVRERGRVFHRGNLTARSDSGAVLDVLPGAGGGARNLLAGGQHLVPGERAACLLVVAGTGEPRQHLRLPTVGLLSPEEQRVVEVRVDSSTDAPSVTAATSEHLYLEFPVVSGLLDARAVRIRPGDDLRRAWDARHGPDAWDARVRAAGGIDAFLRSLEAAVTPLPLAAPEGWRDR
jgi:hypothetical protein